MHHFKYAFPCIIFHIIVLMPAQIHLRYISASDMCLLSKYCTHNGSLECGEEASDHTGRLFLDHCDMLEYNCDNEKEYFTIDLKLCFQSYKENQVNETTLDADIYNLLKNDTIMLLPLKSMGNVTQLKENDFSYNYQDMLKFKEEMKEKVLEHHRSRNKIIEYWNCVKRCLQSKDYTNCTCDCNKIADNHTIDDKKTYSMITAFTKTTTTIDMAKTINNVSEALTQANNLINETVEGNIVTKWQISTKNTTIESTPGVVTNFSNEIVSSVVSTNINPSESINTMKTSMTRSMSHNITAPSNTSNSEESKNTQTISLLHGYTKSTRTEISTSSKSLHNEMEASLDTDCTKKAAITKDLNTEQLTNFNNVTKVANTVTNPITSRDIEVEMTTITPVSAKSAESSIETTTKVVNTVTNLVTSHEKQIEKSTIIPISTKSAETSIGITSKVVNMATNVVTPSDIKLEITTVTSILTKSAETSIETGNASTKAVTSRDTETKITINTPILTKLAETSIETTNKIANTVKNVATSSDKNNTTKNKANGNMYTLISMTPVTQSETTNIAYEGTPNDFLINVTETSEEINTTSVNENNEDHKTETTINEIDATLAIKLTTCKQPISTYPQHCKRPITWETTAAGETRDFFQILKSRLKNRKRF